ncbi:MAG TPA: NAD+ synthase [candidate division Zixibacteria bacterium]
MKITLAQINPTVGDLEGNLKKMISILFSAKKDQSDLVVFPELCLSGYPPKDFLERDWFVQKAQKTLEKLLKVSTDYPTLGILLGTVLPTGKGIGKGLYNSAVLIYQGKILTTQHKSLLPTYDVFDENRYFAPASEIHTVEFKDQTLGISICEDAWNDPELWPKGKIYTFDPIEELAKKRATLFINISASPFYMGKDQIRYRLIHNHVKKHKIPFLFVNQVGGNDELIFDGRSLGFDKNGNLIAVFPSFKEEIRTIDIDSSGKSKTYVPQDQVESVYQALVLGISDYMKKTNFSKAVIGLSGGIDSALTACLAKEAIGKENILGISMPSPFSSEGSIVDSKKLAENLAIEFKVVPISAIYHSYLETLKKDFKGKLPDVTEENIQARIRGNILMAFSNKLGCLVLSTGNKSEMAVGYCTLYGDMSGGLAVLSDVPKTLVYKLADYINRKSEIIPKEIILKPPSAELKPNQTDQDTLPPYDILDQIIHNYIEEVKSPEEIIKMGFDEKTVKWVVKAVDTSEYKRKQAALGLKVTTKAFGVGRRMPVAAKYEG